jgi:hypothetical protein
MDNRVGSIHLPVCETVLNQSFEQRGLQKLVPHWAVDAFGKTVLLRQPSLRYLLIQYPNKMPGGQRSIQLDRRALGAFGYTETSVTFLFER